MHAGKQTPTQNERSCKMETPRPGKEVLDKLQFSIVEVSSQDDEHLVTELLSYQ